MIKAGRTIKARGLVAAAATAFLLLAGCTERIAHHGYTPRAEEISAVELGRDNRAAVIEKLGPPTMGGVLEGDGMYYISYSIRHYAALAPKEIDRTVVAVTFDGRGIARNIETFGLERGNVVSLSRRVTDENLRDTTLLRQILSSIGRFNAASVFGSE